MIPTTTVSLLLGVLGGCYIEQDVLVTEAQTDPSGLAPSFRYAYFREDPARNRIHLRFTDYWDPCITDAQLQNQLRNAGSPARQVEAYQSLLPRRTWVADLYLQLDQWPPSSKEDLTFDVLAQATAEGEPNWGFPCLLRQCPFDARCDTCLPTEPGAVMGLTRATDWPEVTWFSMGESATRTQLYAPEGRITIDVWNPAASLDLIEDTGEGGTIDDSSQISGSADLSLWEATRGTPVGSATIEFTATVCEPMQASFTRDLASFEQTDLNQYGPPACSAVSSTRTGYGPLALALLLALRRRRRSAANSSNPNPPERTGTIVQPPAGRQSVSSKPTAKP